MTNGEVHLPPSGPNQPEFFEMMAGARDRVIQVIQQAGGINFEHLLTRPPDAHGNNMDFKVVSGMQVDGIPLAVKQPRGRYELTVEGFAEQTATLSHIGRKRPDHAPMLPRLHHLLQGNDGEPVGILLEDFTRGGELVSEVEMPLEGFSEMFRDPGVVNEGNARDMVGIFHTPDFQHAKTVWKIVDVAPVYHGKLYVSEDPPSEAVPYYPAWFVEEIGLDRVMANIDSLCINVDDISKT